MEIINKPFMVQAGFLLKKRKAPLDGVADKGCSLRVGERASAPI